MEISSFAFSNNSLIPTKFTCDGINISSELAWKDVPENTKSFALVFDDPDAQMGTWVHWILYNIPAEIRKLDENIRHLPSGVKVGINSFNRQNYGGPCPPSGQHRYIFKLYALDTVLTLPDGATSNALQKAMQKHILAEAKLTGLFR